MPSLALAIAVLALLPSLAAAQGGVCANNTACNAPTCPACACNATSQTCVCADGFSGPTCLVPFCTTPANCSNRGTCGPNPAGGSMCTCTAPYHGAHCELGTCATAADCNAPTCPACACNATTLQCQCADGFSGPTCLVPFCATPADCSNRGTCGPNPAGGSMCTCTAPYHGAHCELGTCATTADCNSAACPDCACNATTLQCQCADGYSGPNCLTPICVNRTAGCSGHGECAVSAKGVQCNCDPPYTGLNCQVGTCANASMCNAPTCPHCTCNATTLECDCADGFSGTNCLTPLCTTASDCSNRGNCTANPAGGVMCTCEAGYHGAHCELGACATTADCNSAACPDCACNATTLQCQCADGYSGPNCLTPICVNRTAGCSGHGECAVSAKGVQCNCDANYHGDTCAVGSCANNSMCNNPACPDCACNLTSLQCACTDDWSGLTCETPFCWNRTDGCSGHGECVHPVPQVIQCACDEGFYADHCQSVCPLVCVHGGVPDTINCTSCHGCLAPWCVAAGLCAVAWHAWVACKCA
jgi:hypothetical protein